MKVNLSSINFSRYDLYSEGKVFSHISNKFLKPFKDRQGYLYVELSNDDKIMVKFSLHRMVAQFFIPNPDNLPEVNHKFGNKEDNDYRSLEWISSSGNSLHAERTGLRNNGKLDIIKVEDICKDIARGLTNSQISKKHKVQRHYISSIKSGRTYKDVAEKYLNFEDYKSNNMTKELVISICEMLEACRSYKEISSKLNVSTRRISEIKNRNTFKEISKPFK